MKKVFTCLFLIAFLPFNIHAQEINLETILKKYLKEVSEKSLAEMVYHLSSDEMEGRKTGEEGQKKAANYIRQHYKNLGIEAAKGTDDYYQIVPSKSMRRSFSPVLKDSENVIAIIEGSEFPEEYVIISAHYDHVGKSNAEVFNGADDNASGTSGVLEIARLFTEAKKAGNGPKRSIIFMHFTGEEYGLFGSNYYVNNPLYPLENTVCDLNIDMIGRTDFKNKKAKNYIYLVGSAKHSKELHDLSEAVNKKYVGLNLDYDYDRPNHPDQIYFRSDHYNFAARNIPVIFYYSGEHEDYHKVTDTADKIEYKKMKERVELIFATTWEIANRPTRLKLDK